MQIVVLSCDKNKDLWTPFYHCMEKYWPSHPTVTYVTETEHNPYYNTINANYPIEKFTKRIRESVSKIEDNYILLMCDDIFIRESVNTEVIDSLINYFDDNTAAINFENHFDKKDLPLDNIVMLRHDEGKYKTSLMIQLWNKTKLLSVLAGIDTDPWNFEQLNNHKGYRYLVNANPHKGLLNFGKVDRIYDWGIVQGKWTYECVNFLRNEGLDINFESRGIKINKCFGIVSYFPWDQPERKQRQDRLDRLIKQLSTYWPEIPIIIIAQQWKFYNPEKICKNKLIRYDYPKLGILGARQELRKKFLESEYNYLIMFDDDAIIQCDRCDAHIRYMRQLDKHPEGFCFIKGPGSSPYTEYNDSQLNLCAISRWIYEREPIPNIDPQKSEAFEDRIWSTLLHFKYADKEFDAPPSIRCIHFKNPNETAPSTWSSEKQFNWRQMRQNTKDIEAYIAEHKELPEEWKK